jgi:hypothetical protein
MVGDYVDCFINDVMSLNNYKFGGYVCRIYSMHLEIKDATDTVKYPLDMHTPYVSVAEQTL